MTVNSYRSEKAWPADAVKHWQEFTGHDAVLDGDGRTFGEIAGERIREAA